MALGLALVPRAVGGPEPERSGPRLVVMTSNLWLGQADARALLRVAREHDVDVLSVQELRPELMRRLDRVGAREQFPGRVVDPRLGAVGSGCCRACRCGPSTRRPTARATRSRRSSSSVAGAPPVRDQGRPPARRRSTATAAPHWRGALAALPGSDSRGDVQILAGDFNATLDHPELRALLDRGYIDAADAVGEGLVWTWPARRRTRALPLTIDHVLVDRRVRVERVTVVRDSRAPITGR